MVAIKSLGVYCSASVCVDDHYRDMAKRLGQLIGADGIRLVYGGADIGMMGAVAGGVLAAKGSVFGVTTRYLGEHEGIYDGPLDLKVVDNMHQRKYLMFQEADAFAILPGGFGTLDEFFEVLTWKQIGLHSKPIVIVNHEGFWNPLKDLLNALGDQHFISKKDKTLCYFVNTVEEVLPTIRDLPVTKIDPTEKWRKNACDIS